MTGRFQKHSNLTYLFLSILLGFYLLLTGYGTAQSNLLITEFMASNASVLSDGDGDTPDWVEIFNPTEQSISLNDCYLTDDPDTLNKWQFPDIETIDLTLVPGEYLLVMTSGKGDDNNSIDYIDSLSYVHANFKLDADGENVILVASDGTTVIDGYWDYPEQLQDLSYGRSAENIIGYLSSPTPGEVNPSNYIGFVEDTKFSIDRGFYNDPSEVTITTETEGAIIKYTLDGSSPTLANGTDYMHPIVIDHTTILRAAAFKTQYHPSNIDTHTYLFISDIITQSSNGQAPGPGWPTAPVNSQIIDYGMDTQVTSATPYSSQIESALLSIPSISIVTDLKNFFDETSGIYVNAWEDGDEWERKTSVELLNPDGNKGFQIDAGIRIRGGGSRTSNNPKHSFRLFFRYEYGKNRLEYPLFDDEGVQEYKRLDLRTGQNFSWHMITDATHSTWLYDVFTRDTHRDMGQPYTRSRYYHLYINGQYWGLYQSEERPDCRYAESYMGGDEEDYDVIKVSDYKVMEAADGSIDAYNQLWTEIHNGVEDNADYYRLQGMNEDGTRNTDYPRLLDVDNLIDYMILIFYGGNRDTPIGAPGRDNEPRNIYAIYNRNDPDGFQFIAHDCENTLGVHLDLDQGQGVYFNRVDVDLRPSLQTQETCNPWYIHLQLIETNPEYRMRFADRVQKHFFNNGDLTPEVAAARFLARKAEIELAVIAESARWGDYLTADAPRTQLGDWLPAVNRILNDYLLASPETRTDVVLTQFKNRGWYPVIDAPLFDPVGGEVLQGCELKIAATTGTIYYAFGEVDPRQIGGSISPEARLFDPEVPVSLSESTIVRARVWSENDWSALDEATFIVLTTTPTPTPENSPTPTFTPAIPATLTPTPPNPPCDLDGDGIMNERDLFLLTSFWYHTSPSTGLNFNVEVNESTLLIFMDCWHDWR